MWQIWLGGTDSKGWNVKKLLKIVLLIVFLVLLLVISPILGPIFVIRGILCMFLHPVTPNTSQLTPSSS